MTHSVGQKLPNPWGLYDMRGNLWEWCQDWYGTYPGGIALDPQGPASGSDRVVRGGSWLFSAEFCRSAKRLGAGGVWEVADRGFRIVLAPSQL